MAGTIELLEVIGKNASLRHACAADLQQALEDMGASEALREAAATGGAGPLKVELGQRDNVPSQNPPPPSCPPTRPTPPPPPPPAKEKPQPDRRGAH